MDKTAGSAATLNYSSKKRISLYSILVNLFLSMIKILGGLFSGSAALMADGVHSLSDLAASVSVFIGIIISNKKSDAFPHGLYKVENLVALVSAFAIFFAGYEIGKDVFFGEFQEIKNLPVALVVLGVTVLITFFYSRFERAKGEALNSPSLIADSEHIKVDFYSAIVVFVGVIAQYFGYGIIEKIAVLVVVALIFHSGFGILKEAVMVLLDASLDGETMLNISSLLKGESEIKSVNHITGRNSGSYKFVQLDVSLHTDSLDDAHEYAHLLEDKIKAQNPFVERVIIHYG